jgi:hypothetical protein
MWQRLYVEQKPAIPTRPKFIRQAKDGINAIQSFTQFTVILEPLAWDHRERQMLQSGLRDEIHASLQDSAMGTTGVGDLQKQ